MDILSFILGYIKGKSQGGESADAALDEVDTYLDSINGGSVHLVTFVGADGKTLCNVSVPNGEDCPDPIATGLTSRPTMSDTLTFRYSFAGWCPYKGGAVDDNALKNITKNKTLYVGFSSVRIRGSCGGESYWTISDDYTTLYIHGNGEIQRIESEYWEEHRQKITSVVFYDTNGVITALGESLFAMHPYLSWVEIPDTVVELKRAVFGLCPSLETITIPSSVKFIGKVAFCILENRETEYLKTATFEATSVWTAYSKDTAQTVSVSSAILSQPSEAAKALSETYVNYEWTRR